MWANRTRKSSGLRARSDEESTAVPHKQQLEGLWSLRPIKELALVCREEGAPFLDPVEAFRQRLAGRPPNEIYIPGGMHFNPAGYRMRAEIQLEFLRTLIPGTTFPAAAVQPR